MVMMLVSVSGCVEFMFSKEGSKTFYISTADVNNSGNLWSVDNGINKYSCAII